MSTTVDATTDHERRISALENILPQAVNDLLYSDPHQWSTRGCPTCRPITELIGQDFGCIRYAKEHPER